MTPHTPTAPAGSSPRGNASRGASVAASPGTHSLPTRAAENPARAPSPAASVAGAFQRQASKHNLILAHAAARNPVAAHGWRWGSVADAASALGVSPSYASRALIGGKFGDLVLRRLGVKP